jgi:hypothetical protein
MMQKYDISYWVKIYASGPIEEAKQIIRRECKKEGLCITIDPTTFIYTGGEENGYVIGFINYPRFSSDNDSIWNRAEKIARILLEETYQSSVLIMSFDKCLWISNRD